MKYLLIGFLRVSQAISRAQEYSADAVAVRAEGQRLDDIGAATHAAVHEHLDLVTDGFGDGRQRADGGGRRLRAEFLIIVFDRAAVDGHARHEGPIAWPR